MSNAFALAVGLSTALLLPCAATADDEIAVDTGPKLRLYGFGDINYVLPLTSSSGNAAVLDHGEMYVGNLNLYVDGQLTDHVRSLSEVRFTYHPSSDSNSTYATDFNSIDSVSWGGIVIERAWVEYAFRDYLAVRAGEFLTPYGIWNVDHGSPTLIGITAPKVVGTQMFPRQQVGIEVYGSRFFAKARLGYHLTVSNGRIGSNPPFENKNGRAAFGGRIFGETEAFGFLRLGVSGYTGRYTGYEHTTVYTQDPGTGAITATPVTSLASQYDERSFGVDVTWKLKGLGINAEFLSQRLAYTSASPPVGIVNGTPSQQTDHTGVGGYVIVSYELPWYGITPWFMVDTTRPQGAGNMSFYNLAPGIDVRFRPNLVVKVQLDHIYAKNLPAGLSVKAVDQLAAQIAYAF